MRWVNYTARIVEKSNACTLVEYPEEQDVLEDAGLNRTTKII
jgi:hypothetical protein